MANGAEKIRRERERQIYREGYSPQHDQLHTAGELVRAAACYADFVAKELEGGRGEQPHPFWPWDAQYWKPADDAVGTLVKAGALIAAEIDRIQAFQTVAKPFGSTRSADGGYPI